MQRTHPPAEGWTDDVFGRMAPARSQPLGEVIARQGPLPADRIATIGAQLARTLASDHAIGVVNRPMSAATIIVRDRDTISFGDQQVFIAAGAFVSPEQLAGGKVGPASDLYRLGALLFLMATGEPPSGPSRPADLPDELADLIGALLSTRPENRPNSAAAMTAVLSRMATIYDPLGADTTTTLNGIRVPQLPAPAPAVNVHRIILLLVMAAGIACFVVGVLLAR